MLSEEEKLLAQIQRRLDKHNYHLQIHAGCNPGADSLEEEADDDSSKTCFFVKPVDWWLTVNAGGEYHFDHF